MNRFAAGHWTPRNLRVLERHYNHGIELVYLKRGHAEWILDGTRWDVPPESVFFTLPWQMHGGVNETERIAELFYVIIPTNPSRMEEPGPITFPHLPGLGDAEVNSIVAEIQQAEKPYVRADALLRRLIVRMYEVLHSRPPGWETLMAACAQTALLETVQAIREGAFGSESPFSHRAIEQTLSRIAERCHEDWSLEEMAALSGYGRTRFSSIVSEITGDSPLRYLNRMRIERAQHLLSRSDASITRISHDCGFNDGAHFSRVFKALTGKTARDYRKLGSTPNPSSPDRNPPHRRPD